MKYTFAKIPAIGLAVAANGQRYDLIGHEPHVRQDGVATTLLVWHAECATCGKGFVSRSPSHGMPEVRRCDEHKSPGRKVRT